jgi:hypothetical protein
VREWASTPPEARAAARAYALGYVIHHAGEPGMAVVRAALVGALGLMLKRGWAEMAPEARAAFFQVRGLCCKGREKRRMLGFFLLLLLLGVRARSRGAAAPAHRLAAP